MLNQKRHFSKFIFTVFIACITGYASYLMYIHIRKKTNKRSYDDYDLATLKMRNFVKHSEPATLEGTDGLSYDFRHMIRLINASSKVWKDLEPSFEITYHKPTIDFDYINSLLQEIMHERNKFKNYIWDLKSYSKSGIPIKQYRSYQYYLDVLDEHAINMRSILKKKDTKH